MSQDKETIPELEKKQFEIQQKILELKKQNQNSLDPAQLTREQRDQVESLVSVNADLMRGQTTEVLSGKNAKAFASSLQEEALSIGDMANEKFARMNYHRKHWKENVVKSKIGALARMLPKMLAIVGAIAVAIIAIVELTKPQILIPFEMWLWPSTKQCALSASEQGGNNATLVRILTEQCTNALTITGYEHVGIIGFLIALIAVGAILAARRARS